jgi:hypothetical protein
MTKWHALYEQHRAMRVEPVDLASSLRQRLIDLARRGHCAETIQGRFTRRQHGALRELFIQSADGCEPLRALRHLEDARLTVAALISGKAEHVHKFSAVIEGMTVTRSPWVAAVHLEGDHEPPDGDQKGSGACGHAAFHCHVGPTMDCEPKVRVPFPAVGPVGALDWLLSIVIPEWEPVPWAAVVNRKP